MSKPARFFASAEEYQVLENSAPGKKPVGVKLA